MKIDVDGGDLDVLRGMSRALQRPSLRSVLIEIDPPLRGQINALLTEAGLRCVREVPYQRTSNCVYSRD